MILWPVGYPVIGWRGVLKFTTYIAVIAIWLAHLNLLDMLIRYFSYLRLLSRISCPTFLAMVSKTSCPNKFAHFTILGYGTRKVWCICILPLRPSWVWTFFCWILFLQISPYVLAIFTTFLVSIYVLILRLTKCKLTNCILLWWIISRLQSYVVTVLAFL